MAIRFAKNDPGPPVNPNDPVKNAVKNISAIKNGVLDGAKRIAQGKPKIKASSTLRTQKWRADHREECRAYNRNYQRKRREKE